MLILFGLLFVAAALTVGMFATKQALLGFPSAIFWFIGGGQAYVLASGGTGTIYYIIFIACGLGMGIYSIFAAYSLREKRDAIGDEEMEKGDKDMLGQPLKTGESFRTKRLHDNAAKRRTRTGDE
jgi:hypothetical protein